MGLFSLDFLDGEQAMTKEFRQGWVPGALAILLTIMAAAAALTPYFILIPEKNLTLITQAQTTLWAGWLLMLGYYFGSTSSSKGKDDTIGTLAKTAQTAGAALPSVGPDSITIAPGDSATATATDAGTVITPDTPKKDSIL